MVVTIKENGTSQTDTCAYNKVDKINNSDVDFCYINVSPAFVINMKDEISLLDYNQTKIFGGYIRSINYKTLKQTIAFGYDVLLSDIEIQKNFENFSPEGIIEYCCDEAGLIYNSTISSGIIIELYPAKDKKLKNIIDDMLNLLGAVGRVDNDKNYYLEYPGEKTNSITLEIGQNCTMDKGWDLDTDNLCTQVKVKGDTENVQTEQFFSGTGSQTEFELANIFVTVKVLVDGVEQTPQISGVQTGDYEIVRETKKIIFQAGSIPSSGTDNIQIIYTYDREITYTEASEIILPDKSNLHQKTIKKDYLKSIDEVRAFANDYLNKFSQPLISATLVYDTLNVNNFNVNESINVIDNIRKVNGEYVNKVLIIKRLRREFGNEGARLLIDVSENTDFVFNRRAEQENRLKQLEENITSAELLQFGIKTQDTTVQQFDVDIFNIEKRTYPEDTFYLLEDSGAVRNQMLDDGTGPIMRDIGYTSEDLDGLINNRITQAGDNRITQAGDNRITQALAEDTTNASVVSSYAQNIAITNFVTEISNLITHIAVGDDNTTPTESDTTLNNETYRESCTVLFSGNVITYKTLLDITENNGNTVKEMGAFNAASGGDMYYKNLTTVVDKDGNTEIFLSGISTSNSQNTTL